ncbi:MAG: hypothetical protein ABJB40_02140 [Acidobacteriota bacterium]
MELEFDKEIDAILRKARPARGVLVGDDPPNKHLDADVIAAFAEDALPEKAKLLYMEHFADCDKCRKLLSQTILMNTEAVSSVDETASVVAAPVAEISAPWYQGLFKTQNLALTMGGLVLVFTGVLGYMLLQNQNAATNESVAKVTESEPPKRSPYDISDSASTAANTASNTNAANAASNTVVPDPNTAPYDAPTDQPTVAAAGRTNTPSNTAINPADRGDSLDEQKKAEKDDKTSAVGGVMAPAAKPDAPLVKELPVNGRNVTESVVVDGVDSKDAALAKRKQTEDRRETRDLPMAASKVGPSRSGPLQNQSNQINNKMYDMSVKRTISGKTFENRESVWYDLAYHGQATTNVRRGTDEYKKLDGGLRNIANTLGGTVVVVWKEKAYRIQ